MTANLKRWWSRLRHRPTLHDFWQLDGRDGVIVSVTPWRDLLVIATQYRVYVVTPGPYSTDLMDFTIHCVGRAP